MPVGAKSHFRLLIPLSGPPTVLLPKATTSLVADALGAPAAGGVLKRGGENERMTKPAFLTHRWAACSNPECDDWRKHRRVKLPIPDCRLCGGKLRTDAWRGWSDSKLARRAVVERTLRRSLDTE